MSYTEVVATTRRKFFDCYGREPGLIAYAPGRVEVLGNHTDYNEGLVLSAAIERGTCFAVAPASGTHCRLVAGDLMSCVEFEVASPAPVTADTWANYPLGVLAGLLPHGQFAHGFDALFFSNVPLGSGLSSSAALEMSCALALARLYRIELPPLELARIGQQAEHLFAGVRCGLLDQISSLYGRHGELVLTDFRTLEVAHVPFAATAALLICNTHARHALVDGAFNERRSDCEAAAAYFGKHLPQPVTALRDVTTAGWEQHQAGLEQRVARRALHPIGESERVERGAVLLRSGDLAGFGRLMFASHESSRSNFENSCDELDFLVSRAEECDGVLGARLTGGGFGGSVVVLVESSMVEEVAASLADAYRVRYGEPCGTMVAHPAAGAHIVGEE